MAAARGAAGCRGPGRPCPFSIEHILSGLPESSPPARAARPPPPAGRQSPAEPGQPEAPEAVPCACCCCCGPRAAPRGSPEPAAGLGARLPWPLRLGPAAPLPLAAPTGGSGAPPDAGGPGPQRRTRRHRTIFSEEQLQALEALFVQNQYPDVGTRERLAGRIRLREERVEVGACSLGRAGPAWRAEAHRPRESRGAGWVPGSGAWGWRGRKGAGWSRVDEGRWRSRCAGPAPQPTSVPKPRPVHLGTARDAGPGLGLPERPSSSSGLVQEPPGQVATPEARIGVREAPAGSQEAPEGELLTAAELLLGSVAPSGAGSGRGQTYPNRSWERTPASNLVSAQLPASWSSTREPLCVCPRATRPAEGERTDAPCSMRLPFQGRVGRKAGETRGWDAGHRADQLPQPPTTPQEAPSHPRTGATPCQQ
ncbi:hypothetical protein J1605_015308 [Eschrichtius robustus]|uniref:Homeobox domain-containing protein n=1 Tax=Eschrichtius robustus TaxID=9764 RepID=A0AB34GEH7_ESCRO|nr:hypothetical protein J1605_015308 [Eschrichtius robustus]